MMDLLCPHDGCRKTMAMPKGEVIAWVRSECPHCNGSVITPKAFSLTEAANAIAELDILKSQRRAA